MRRHWLAMTNPDLGYRSARGLLDIRLNSKAERSDAKESQKISKGAIGCAASASHSRDLSRHVLYKVKVTFGLQCHAPRLHPFHDMI